MAASATDYFQEVGLPGSATTLASPGYTIGNSSINVVSTNNWPTATGVIFAIDQVQTVNGVTSRIPNTYCEFAGVVPSSGVVNSLNLITGTPQNYAAGATTRVYIPVTSGRENRLIHGIGISFDQDGTLKAGAVDNTAVLADGVVVTAKLADAAITNAKLATGAGDPGGAWTTWTPTWSNITVGNGTVVARYQQIGRTIRGRLSFTLGTTSTIGTFPSFTIPLAANGYNTVNWNIGFGYYTDIGVTTYSGTLALTSSNTAASPLVTNTGGTYAGPQNIGATAPHTWGSGDVMTFTFEYEAA